MKQMMKNYPLGALACIVMGIALVINPHIISQVLNTAIGVILIVWAAVGIIGFIASRSSDSRENVSIFSLISDLVMLGLGIYVFVNPMLLETIVMTALGLYLTFSGISKVSSALKIRKYTPDNWVFPAVGAVITLLLGIFILVSPTFLTGGLMSVVGIVLIIAGAVHFISEISAAKTLEKISGGGKKRRRSVDPEDGSKIVDVKNYKEN